MAYGHIVRNTATLSVVGSQMFWLHAGDTRSAQRHKKQHRITDAKVDQFRKRPPSSGNLIEWDKEKKGFGVRINAAGAVLFSSSRIAIKRVRNIAIQSGAAPEILSGAARADASGKDKGRNSQRHRPIRAEEESEGMLLHLTLEKNVQRLGGQVLGLGGHKQKKPAVSAMTN